MQKEIIIIVLYPGNFLLRTYKRFIDLGWKEGDTNIVSPWTGKDYELSVNPEDLPSLKNIYKGAKSIMPTEYTGEEGQKIKQFILNQLGAYSACQYVEEMLIVAHGIKRCIEQGQDFQNPFTLASFMRANKFIGCSGTVKFKQNENFRDGLGFFIMNNRYDED